MKHTKKFSLFLTFLSSLLLFFSCNKTANANYSKTPPVVTTSTSQPTPGPVDNTIPSSEIEAPSDLTPTTIPHAMSHSYSVSLSWSPSNTEDIDGYIIYRGETNDGEFNEIGNVSKDKTTYIDAVINQDDSYYYYVRAYKDYSKSEKSNTVVPTSVSFNGTGPLPMSSSSSEEAPKSMTPVQFILIFIGFAALAILLTFLAITFMRKRKGKLPKPKDDKKPPEAKPVDKKDQGKDENTTDQQKPPTPENKPEVKENP